MELLSSHLGEFDIEGRARVFELDEMIDVKLVDWATLEVRG